MLKHVHHSGSSLTATRGVSPAPSSASSVSTEGSASSLFSPRSIYSTSSASQESAASSSSFSWRRLSECRTSSRLSLSENPNAIPLRVYAAALRPDIQYKTVGVIQSTTCEEVIAALLAKCKVRFKDPRLFHLAMEVDIRGPNGCDTRASIQLEDSASPLQLQECYPKGQARFCLKMKPGSLVKVFDGSNTVGWQYKSIMISEKTTAAELVDILFRYVIKSLFDTKYYTLHIEVDAWKRKLDWDESVIPAQNIARQWGTPKLILGCQDSRLPTSLLLGNSTSSLYENVHCSQPRTRDRDLSLNSSGVSEVSSASTSSSSSESCTRSRDRWRRSKSLTDRPTEAFTTYRQPVQFQDSLSSSSSTLLHQSHSRPSQNYDLNPSLTDSVRAGFARLNTRFGKYELSEAFFV